MKYARIIEKVAVDVASDHPSQLFHPSIANQFTDVPPEVEKGWRLEDDGTWSAPEIVSAPPPEPVYRTAVSRPEFKMLFKGAERIAIAQARQGGASTAEQRKKAILDDFFDIIEDPALETIRLNHATVQEGLAYLVSEGLLTQDRVAEISMGIEI